MRGETGRANLFTRRAIIVGGAQALLTAGLAGRLYQLQVVDSERYQVLADENRINMQLLPPARGRIFDRFGQVLAENRLNYRLILVPEAALNLDKALDEIAQLVPVEDHDRERVLREARRNQKFVPITVREHLTWEEVSQIEVNAPDLPGVMIDVGRRRLYAFGQDTVHIVGYVGAVNEADLERTDDPLLSLPDFRIGKNGAEKVLETSLRGEAGSRQVEVNAYGRVIRELSRRTGRPGDDHMLTIDLGLQQYVSARFGDESGSAVVLDIHSGDILALASMPSYDPNLFTSGISQRQWRELIGHPRFPLTNKSIAGQYSPGSTFKMIVALAALEGGGLSPHHRFFCDGSLKLGKRRFRCWRRHGHGHVDMIKGLTESCDVYFYEVAKRIGIDRIAAMAERFGFGRQARHRAARREARAGADEGVEARHDRRALAGRRDAGRRHRPGLPAHDAAPARGHGGAHRQRRHRGGAAHSGGDDSRRAADRARERDLPHHGHLARPLRHRSQRHAQGRERPQGHRLPRAHRGAGARHGRQDRKRAGEAHFRA